MRWTLLTLLLWTLALTSPAPMSADVKQGEFRSWHANGQLAELRHYVDGREVGRQQSWTADGLLFLNYEVRNGRRYGLVNARPCQPGDDAGSGVMR